jgi:hypothetical protein
MNREHDAGRRDYQSPLQIGSRKEIYMYRLTRGVLALSALSVASALAVHAQDYKKTVIYQVVTDRFYDGSTSNDKTGERTARSTTTGR